MPSGNRPISSIGYRVRSQPMSSAQLARVADSFFRPALGRIVPYEPGKPAEEVQRELGLDRVVKLASNEGPFGPFPAAQRGARARDPRAEPLSGRRLLPAAPCARRTTRRRAGARGAGIRRRRGRRATSRSCCLDPGDEIVCGWPSFPSYVLGRAEARRDRAAGAARADERYDLDGLLDGGDASGRRSSTSATRTTRPGPWSPAMSSTAYFERVPDHVLTVLDEAYFEYVDDPELPGRDRGVPEGGPAGAACCGRSRRSTASPVCASATASGRRRS